MRRTVALLALVVAAALTLTACGETSAQSGAASPTQSSTATSSDVNAADVTFAQSMIPHHQQAVQMAQMAQTHAHSDEVMQLATKIEAAQGPEIQTMQNWLESWGRSQPSASTGHGDHGMGDMDISDMPGMMSDSDLQTLDQARDAAWDRMFLEMMIRHHQGAIEMADTEQSRGRNPEAIALAEKIAADQQAEIAEMRSMVN